MIEMLELFGHEILFTFLIYWRQTGMSESSLPVQCLVDQKRLSNSSPAIYGDQMGLVTLVKSMQLLDFLFLPIILAIEFLTIDTVSCNYSVP